MKTGICRRCGCTLTTPCLDDVCGACWWMDKNKTLCSHCFYGFNDEPYQTKVYYRPGHDFLERDTEFAWATLADLKSHWVYDMEHDVLCVVGLGDHIGAVRFIARKFYGLDRIYRDEIPKWQEIIANKRKREEGITRIKFFGYHSDAELCSKVYEGAILYLKYRLKRLLPTIPKAHWINYKKSYLLGFLEGLDQRFKEQSQSTEEFSLMVQVPAEVLEEQCRRMGNLKSRTINIEIDVDCEAYFIGLEHAKKSKLIPEELLQA